MKSVDPEQLATSEKHTILIKSYKHIALTRLKWYFPISIRGQVTIKNQ